MYYTKKTQTGHPDRLHEWTRTANEVAKKIFVTLELK